MKKIAKPRHISTTYFDGCLAPRTSRNSTDGVGADVTSCCAVKLPLHNVRSERRPLSSQINTFKQQRSFYPRESSNSATITLLLKFQKCYYNQ